MRYELYYWPSIQGRGEFVRLALEDAGADYIDVARRAESSGMGMPAMMKLLDGEMVARPPFAPPFLRAGQLLIGQTANILQFLGPRLNLVPDNEADRLWAHQLQLTLADLVTEAHDAHHPLSVNFYYEDQRQEARRRAADFLAERVPKFLGYFENLLARNDTLTLVGDTHSYVDVSLFQVMEGLRYAFPRAMRSMSGAHARLWSLHERVMHRPQVAKYLRSRRRIAFNESGIFRHYAELDMELPAEKISV